ncbi:methylenetetrahydrofolate reductase [NAD(P)H] [Thermoclostridium stercorarium subsp. thermolacticum DSM 2910]|uniref:Methylenetetrahydrofolate reductase n=2 Tax=Thermoclostridium stercorarium TaxID=1510 RepID=A0A1B1YNE5_THEST|nr:methylenetetrahydrofolate reductase [NAD(P)H] [Thermoclostridium stercorarium]ANW99681.1 methylenetetrahydrofolate reductase [NAD(P)H] [Thermoclostridium stercorarium subsp. thermolacticum DSM 2910]ANX02307.1 methylenetetrahydrofolate reductase [NAD(P)H] [Thermoclostridium stercorarium subsp. leptospartum DSM 9219]UZQ85385.1 methylenetetrahydrofolate reductase [NAD(P)H] [Thermoclostridium stercorarium]
MKITEFFERKKQTVSFEIFPPKLDTPIETILNKLGDFAQLKPDFISVTYGAGGSKKGRTVEIASKIKNEYGIESLAHFTCVGHSIEEIDDMINKLKNEKIDNILALRGDPPKDMPDFDFSKNVFSYASELIRHIRKRANFCIGAACYPEGHVDSPRIRQDIYYLKQKVNEGVDFLITQLFFDNRIFYDFMDKLLAAGITCPVLPGIMPIFRADQIKRIASMCGASMPAKLVLLLDKYGNTPDMQKAGIEYATNQLKDLLDNGVHGIHINTMNNVEATRTILQNLGLFPG